MFRLEYELGKTYSTFLNVKLLRRVTNARSLEEKGLCVRKVLETKYEVINEQELELKRESIDICERIYFRASEFYSSIDIYLFTFNYGFKAYRSKLQISNHFSCDLHCHSATLKMREKCEGDGKNRKEELFSSHRAELLTNIECEVPSFYY